MIFIMKKNRSLFLRENAMRYIILIFMTLVTTAAASQNIDEKVQRLLHPEKSDMDISLELLSYGKDAIPFLIKVIDVNEKGFIGFKDPLDSRIPDAIYNSLGMRAAYEIELILAMDERANFKNKRYNHLFGYGYIVRTVEKEQLKAMTNEDMKVIKAIYLKWWGQNKTKNINQLKNDWQKGHQPLSNSGFIWI